MANPVKKTTRGAKRRRASHHSLSPMNLVACSACGKKRPAHTACAWCGAYRTHKVKM